MIVLYPFTAKSNTDDFLNFESPSKNGTTLVPAVRMMETSEQANFGRVFKSVKVRETLTARDYRSLFRPGDFLYIKAPFGTVACVATSYDIDEETLDMMYSGFEAFGREQAIVSFSGFERNVPGIKAFTDKFKAMENFTNFDNWDDFVESINKETLKERA
jgi:hypothetical protein